MTHALRCATLASCMMAGCGGDWQLASRQAGSAGAGGTAALPPVQRYPTELRAAGNRIVDADGSDIVLRGVNRSGTEYQCTKRGVGIFDGRSDDISLEAMRTWRVNAVRVPLNEHCWLGINGADPGASGQIYRDAIVEYVERLHAHGLVPILELHWAAPGEQLATELWPMPNADHSLAFWRDVATTFLADTGVILEPYNEPYPDRNGDSTAAWECWRDGCEAFQWQSEEGYEAVGMQAVVDAIRETGSRHLLLLGGVQYSNRLTEWLAYKPHDPLENLGAAWHVYDFNGCVTPPCWEAAPADVAASYPVVATEIGQSNCLGDSFLSPLMHWLDERSLGYLAWSWNTGHACTPRTRTSEGTPWALISSYTEPIPNSEYARTFREHLEAVAPLPAGD